MINLDNTFKRRQLIDVGGCLSVWMVKIEEELTESKGEQRLAYIFGKVIEIAGVVAFCKKLLEKVKS